MNGSALGLNFAIGSVAACWQVRFGINGKGPFPLGGLRRPPRIAPSDHWRRHHGRWRDFGLWLFCRQGITAFSLLAYSGPVTFAAIFLGRASA